MELSDFAEFAILWTSLRMFTFYGANNLYIIYFNQVRNSLLESKSWPVEVSSNILITSVVFCIVIAGISYFLFGDLLIVGILIGCLIGYIIIRNVAEFAKSDNNLFVSILIDDILFYLLFFVFSLIAIQMENSLLSVMLALLASSIITAIVSIILFIRKFKLKYATYNIKTSQFSFTNFKLGINYTFLRGNEVLSNFAVRYLGQIYFGDLFVAYAHIMYQFYNIFSLMTMAVISGMQSKITVKAAADFSRRFYKVIYKRIIKTILPFAGSLLLVLLIFNSKILEWFFPKFTAYNKLLIKVGFAGLIFAFIQPLVFILVYNNRFLNILKLNYTQYLVMLVLFSWPWFFPETNEQIWFLLVMISLVLVQGSFAFRNFVNLK